MQYTYQQAKKAISASEIYIGPHRSQPITLTILSCFHNLGHVGQQIPLTDTHTEEQT